MDYLVIDSIKFITRELKKMSKCAFCNIINRECESKLIYETESIVSFLDRDPINEGHLLIVPKIHVDSIEKKIYEENGMCIYKKIYRVEGYSIMQNGGQFCDFGHFHLHLFPRYPNDGFGWTYPKGPFEYSQKVAERIRKELE